MFSSETVQILGEWKVTVLRKGDGTCGDHSLVLSQDVLFKKIIRFPRSSNFDQFLNLSWFDKTSVRHRTHVFVTELTRLLKHSRTFTATRYQFCLWICDISASWTLDFLFYYIWLSCKILSSFSLVFARYFPLADFIWQYAWVKHWFRWDFIWVDELSATKKFDLIFKMFS